MMNRLLAVRSKVRKLSSILTLNLVSLFGVITILILSKPSSFSSDIPLQQEPPFQQVSLIFLGDIMQHMPQVEAAWDDNQKKYNYDSCFIFIKPIISQYDLAIANLETTLAGKPYSGYPAFSSPDELVSGMINAGIDLVGTANNHCCDRGEHGLKRTVSILDSLGLDHFGTYRDEASYGRQNPKLIRKNGISLAFLNYTYGTNGIPVPDGTVVSLIEKERIRLDLQKAKDSLPDQIIIFIHWGEEYQREPNAFQKDIAHFCFENGANIIIGSHPHVLQPMEWQTADSLNPERLVVWSLGNYVSNQRKRYTDGGAMAELIIRKENGRTSIADANFQLSWVYNPLINGKRQYYILPAARFETDSTFTDRESREAMSIFLNDSRELLKQNIRIPEKR